jgi:anti-anti-sigma regulatory factor/PAS domain-containing protein
MLRDNQALATMSAASTLEALFAAVPDWRGHAPDPGDAAGIEPRLHALLARLGDHELAAAAVGMSHVDGGLVIDDGLVAYANSSATKLFAATHTQLHGHLAASLLGLDDGADATTWLAERDGEIVEADVRRTDGQLFPARIGVTALDSVRRRFALSVQDLSDVRAAAQLLEQELVAFEARRAALIDAQRDMIRALSLPLLRVWQGVLAVPLLGPLDETRAADTLERLLAEVAAARILHVIIDMTGLQSLDLGSVAYLARMIRALRLVGSQCVIAGIKPALARTLVEQDIPLADASCYSSQHEALAAVLERLGWQLVRRPTHTGGLP